MKPKKTCIISAGELSGDQHAALLVESMKRLCSDVEYVGYGGGCMQNAGVRLIGDYRQSGGIMGFGDAIKKVGAIYKAYQAMSNTIKNTHPSVIILVDYADFNMRLARVAYKLRIPVLYFIPPKVWAWRKKRIIDLKRVCAAIASIFPFETDYLQQRGVEQVEFVGHPFCDEEIFRADKKVIKQELCEKLQLDPAKPVLSILVGSRKSEVLRHMPAVEDAIGMIRQKIPVMQFVFVKAKSIGNLSISSAVEPYVMVTDLDSRFVMMGSDIGIVKSGTSTLEAAFAELPFVCIYQAPKITEMLLRIFTSLESISLPNLIRPHSITELVQDECNGNAIADEVFRLYNDPDRIAAVNNLRQVKMLLGSSQNSYDNVARMADTLMQEPRM